MDFMILMFFFCCKFYEITIFGIFEKCNICRGVKKNFLPLSSTKKISEPKKNTYFRQDFQPLEFFLVVLDDLG